MSWYEEIDELAEGRYIKFDSGKPVKLCFLTREPVKKMKELRGDIKPTYEWKVAVLENGSRKEKNLSATSVRLLKLIKAEDQKASLLGRCFEITAHGDGFNRTYTMTEVTDH
jgi:hypothetical protein